MDPIVASLWSSFRRVPPVAIPAMLDCILASTAASPSSLFSDLLNELPNLTKGIVQKSETMESEWHNCVVSYVAALSHFLKKSGAHHMHMFIWKMLIPLLKLVHTSNLALFNEAARLFLDVVTETNSWEVLEATMVPLLLRSIGLSMGMFQSEDLAIYKWSENSTFKGSIDKKVSPTSFDDSHDTLVDKYTCGDFLESHSYDLPFSMSCHILTLTLDAALLNKDEGVFPASTLASGSPAKQFAGNMLWDLSNLTLHMLSQSSVHRSSAIRFLLPFIFKAFAHDSTFKVAVPGMNQVLTRRDAYDILSLYLSFSLPTEQYEDSTVGGRAETFDLRADEDFWNEIKRGLLDKESLVRKQSLHILKTTLNLSKERKCNSHIAEEVSDEKGSDPHMISKRRRWAQEEAKSLGVGRVCNQIESSFTGQHRWEAFVFLYEMLEEYGTHLVEAAWNHQIMLWLRSSIPLENSVPSVSEEQYYNRMATAEQIFEWLAVLWERGFCHDNPQVRCLIMQSFLAIEWENYGCCAKLVPKDFILGPLIRGLNDPVHHKEFGVKEIYSSWIIDAAARFMCKYASYMERRQHISFLVDLSSVPKTHSFGRAGLMCLVECIASAACGTRKHNNHEVEQLIDANTDLIVVESAPNSWKNDRADLLDVLRFVVECSKRHFNPKYRHQVCEKILAAVDSVMIATDVPLEILLHFISSVPPEYTNYRGSLRHVVQKWLCGPNLQLLKAIQKFPGNFISCQHPLDSPFTFDDEQLDAWGSEAKRWARILFLVVVDEEHFDPILKIFTTVSPFMQFIEDHSGDVCKKKNYSEWAPVKFLILVSRLVEEVQIIQERTAKHCLSGGIKGETDFPGRIDNLSFTEESIIIDKFVEELVTFTKLSCSIFWSGVVTEDMSLPGSIRGKLGGPSQRRLPSSLCTSVLEAISATKTLASSLRCCSKFRTDVVTNSAQTFLWNFCWKIITTPAPKSEVEAEICLAAYEACAYALNDLVSVFSPSSLDLLANNYKSFPSEAEGKALLDAFVTTFIHNINNIIDGGKLTRSRRAVLISWKKCKRWQEAFQYLRSLEHAGEVSVLPMLRSVRLSMELLNIKRTDLDISCSGGITIEGTQRLVTDSYEYSHVFSVDFLSVSCCNKRRVAPIAALLSSVLHYSVFGDGRMHEFDNGPGPLKWDGFISFASYFFLIGWFCIVAFDEDFEAELAENHDARTEVSMLSRRLDPELTDVFINTELYARVSVAVLFSKLADMAYLTKSTARDEEYLVVIGSGKMFLLELLNSVVNDKDLSKELYKKYSAIHRRKVRAWQMICVLSRFVDLEIVEQVTSSLHTSICRNNLPSVRQYLETFAIYIYLSFPSLVSQQLVPLLRNYDLRPQALSSYVFIAANVILHGKKVTQFGHLDELLPPIVPLLTSHHHTLRGFTQILLYQVLQKLLPGSNSSACDSMSLEQRCFLDLRDYLAHNSDCARQSLLHVPVNCNKLPIDRSEFVCVTMSNNKLSIDGFDLLRASMDSYLDSFDPVKSISRLGFLLTGLRIIPVFWFLISKQELEFECVPPTLMDRVIDFLNDTREDLRSSMAKDAASIKIESILIDEGPKCSEILKSNGRQSVIQPQEELLYDFQRKITFSNNDVPDSAPIAFLDKTTSYGSLLAHSNPKSLQTQPLPLASTLKLVKATGVSTNDDGG
ncbi:UNVERIFIED_CONTAM: hypothetical protein Scaly_0980300 [Sesamum calycinum]|uniref:ARM repeat superfamily protein n=1 Tax=Sesamum calycinum TaxID=2727403 RepID=A0AAW2QYJ2_9LAMI